MEEVSNSSQEHNGDHVRRLEEIDREQRLHEEQETDSASSVFAESVVEALDSNVNNASVPLLDQEEIDDEEPPRVNLTAVICTAIVAVCATIILCVAQPWKDSEAAEPVKVAQNDESEIEKAKQEAAEKARIEAEKKAEAERKAAEEKARIEEQQRLEEQKKQEEAKKKESITTLPIITTTKTKSNNKYNSVRLIDASSRPLTHAEVEQMSLDELFLARNAIVARHGYQYNNSELREFFAAQSWFKPSDVKVDAIPYTQIENDNIKLIKARETALTN